MNTALRILDRLSALLFRRRQARRAHPVEHRSRYLVVGAGGVAVLSIALGVALTGHTGPSRAEQLQAYISSHAQKLDVQSTPTAATAATRDDYAATPGIRTLSLSGTNYDWARIVLVDGGWTQSDANITVLTRWMRQENGADDWWNRNNPLNNGYGSGGGGGTGSFANLDVAAQMAAAMLHHNPGMAGIVAGFAAGNSTTPTEQAIWASPWASSHYGNGSRWHYTPVDVVTAPASAW